MTSELALVHAFDQALADHCAERIVPFPHGRALFNDTFPRVWDLNFLRADLPVRTDASTLAEEADRLQGPAGLEHRQVVVRDEEEGARLAPGFGELGWEASRFILMVYRGPSSRRADTTRVEEVDAAALQPLREAISRDEPWATDEETVRMVVDGNALVAREANARHFAVRAGGEVVAATDLYSDGRTAQVEDVATLPEHRGRGHASAVVLRAVEEALAAGHDLVFLGADEDDWPKDLYARLGFERIGGGWHFLRKPAPAVPA